LLPPEVALRSEFDHPGQAEFALNIAANFDCLKNTPAHDAVRAALARVAEARNWVRKNSRSSGRR
jgi:hypothetical protein